MTRQVFLNGRYLGTKLTGVQRVAYELTASLDGLLSSQPNVAEQTRLTLLHPRGNFEALSFKNIEMRATGQLEGILWEQLHLPAVVRDDLLVNLCNVGPILPPRTITMIHDAQVYLSPESYNFAFRQYYKMLQPLLARGDRTILTVSEFSKKQLVKFGIAPADKISVVYNGCDHMLRITPATDTLRRLGLEDVPFALGLATTYKHKNIGVLLRAFGNDSLRSRRLVLFGSNTQSDFEALGYKIPSNVMFVGRIADKDLSQLMRHAAAFCFPSRTEGFGLPPLEAMSLGCPAVVAPCGALPEVCGDAALYADPDEPSSWESAVNDLCENTALRAKMQALGHARAAQYTWSRGAAQLWGAITSFAA